MRVLWVDVGCKGRSGRVVSAQAHDRQQLLVKCRLKANPRRGRITSLSADGISASHKRLLDVLDPQVRTALEFAESRIAKRRKLQAYPGANDALEIERLMDVVRATTRDMYSEEERLLSQRAQRAGAGQRLTKFIAIVGALLGAGLWVLARLAVGQTQTTLKEEGLTKGVYFAGVADEFLGAPVSRCCELFPPVGILIPLATWFSI